MVDTPENGAPSLRLPRLEVIVDIIMSLDPDNAVARQLRTMREESGLSLFELFLRASYRRQLDGGTANLILVTDANVPTEIEGTIFDLYIHVDPSSGRRWAFIRLKSIGLTPAILWGQLAVFGKSDVRSIEESRDDIFVFSVRQHRDGGSLAAGWRPVATIKAHRPFPGSSPASDGRGE